VFPAPQFLFVHVNRHCNLRWTHFDFPNLNDSDKHHREGGNATRARMSGCNQICNISQSVCRETRTQALRGPQPTFPRSDMLRFNSPRAH